jgi:hypothetical protein
MRDADALLEHAVGREGLELLAARAGGLTVYVAHRPPLGGPLADLPLTAQRALAAWAGGTKIYIPTCGERRRAERDAAIRAAYAAGARVRDLARRYRISERWVYAILSRAEG